MGPENAELDWSRLAEPQADHYDSLVILKLASTTTSVERPEPYVRRPVSDSPTVFDGMVAVRHVYRNYAHSNFLARHYLDAPADHPNVQTAAEYVRRWPIVFAQCQQLLDSIHPAIDPRIPFQTSDIYRGSSSHSYGRLFGTMWATIYCPFGLAEAIVHEMAHQKLRTLGVSFEHATTMIANDPSELYESPVIRDRLRPMSAVLHAEYSYVHVTSLDIHMLASERDSARREVMQGVLRRNLARIEQGLGTIKRHLRPSSIGHEFIEAFLDWSDRTIQVARDSLRN